MGTTNIPYGSPLANKVQSAGLFAANMQRQTTLNRLTGPMPKQAEAESRLGRRQSSNTMPIVRAQDLTKGVGDEVTFDLVNPMGGKPIMGDAVAEGRGMALTFNQDRLRINQARYPVNAGSTMTQQRTPHQMRTLARAAANGLMEGYSDQSILVHMAGARGFHNNIEWNVPLESDPDFANVMVNRVKAPSRNRHLVVSGDSLTGVVPNAGAMTIQTTDIMTMDTVDAIGMLLDSMALPPPPVKMEGDKAASDAPLRVLLVSGEQYGWFIKTGQFRQLQANAMARAQQAGQHPLFMGQAGMWNNTLLVKMPKPIRFYAGDKIKYCAAYDSEAESEVVVPAGFSTTHAVDRALLLGGQALAEAWGNHPKSGTSYFWSEKETDHEDKLEVSVAAIGGRSKIRFEMDFGNGKQITDFGVIAIDTAVKLATPRG